MNTTPRLKRLLPVSNSHFGAGAGCGTPASAGSPHEFRGCCRLKAAFRGPALGCTLQNENCWLPVSALPLMVKP
jgi:hypothetical protein